MKNWIINLVLVLLLSSLCISACSPGQFLGPTVTPTQTAAPTSTPTITVTPTIDPSPTATVTLEPTKKTYAIDMEKFFNPAPSYEYMVAHPEEYVEAPDLLSDVEAFKDWYYNKYIPALLEGHEEVITDMDGNTYLKRNITNLITASGGQIQQTYVFGVYNPLAGELPIAFFIHEGVMYPILAFTLNVGNGIIGNVGTFSIILHPEDGSSGSGFGPIRDIYEGKKIYQLNFQKGIDNGTPDVEITQKFLGDGFNWQAEILRVGPFFNIGLGTIDTY